VLFLALVFGLALSRLGDHGRPIMNLLHDTARVFFGMVGYITKAAPLAAALAPWPSRSGKYGIGTLGAAGILMACVYLTCAVVHLRRARAGLRGSSGFGLMGIMRTIKEELLIVLGTSSSESALPGLMQKMEKMGCSRSVVGVVVPSGIHLTSTGPAST
jgi:aerobic C4-dicarboxylate transport protein